MGDKYRDAVLACLEAKEAKLGVTVDDATQGKLLEAFKDIVDILETGRDIL